MFHTRRSVLKKGGLFALGTAAVGTGVWPSTSIAGTRQIVEPLFPDGHPDRRRIIQEAIDSAMSAGASYADARLTHHEEFSIGYRAPNRYENMAFGVRVLYQGYWGFAASPVWSTDEAVRLGRAATNQARANVLGRERITELAPINASEGHWETPVTQDPFKIDYDEISDFFGGLSGFIGSLKFIGSFFTRFAFSRTHKAFGNSMGQFNTQLLYSSGGAIAFSLEDKEGRVANGEIEEISPAGQGFEYFRDRPLRDYIRKTHEESLEDLSLPFKPIDAGRYNVLVDQHGVGSLLGQSIGAATEVDRVFGFEANAGGTSYIDAPDTMLGNYKIGSPLLNVVCDRSEAGSVGRVRWDDEGVTPSRYDLVRKGVLVNLQTNREGASWIKDYYSSTGQEFRSSGSAAAPSALEVQLVHKADLYLTPSETSSSRDDMRKELGDGLEMRVPDVTFDFQQITGLSRGRTYEVKKGRRVSRLLDAGMLFRTPELWSNLVAVGGKDSVRYYGRESKKGQPEQSVMSALYVPPVTFKEMTFIDVKRKG